MASTSSPATRAPHALVYGDVNLNIIDGSAVWLQSTVLALSQAGCRVTVLLKAPVQATTLLEPLLAAPGVTVRRPFEEALFPDLSNALSARQAALLLAQLDEADRSDLVVLRGLNVVREVVGRRHFNGRLWTYLTDIPQSVADLSSSAVADLERIASASRLVLCQTEQLRCFLETAVPGACGKSVLFPPAVPDADFVATDELKDLPSRRLSLVYSGKFAPRWNTLEMCQLPALLDERGIAAAVKMVGDKVHQDPADATYFDRMRSALQTVSGVQWVGRRSRREAMAIAREGDFGLSWRDPSMAASLELSTKVLEYGAVGLPVLLNRTPMHEDLLGIDYPFFVESLQDIVLAVELAQQNDALYRLGVARCYEAAQSFTLARSVERLQGYLGRVFPMGLADSGAAGSALRPTRVLVASHDLKFFTGILSYLEGRSDVEVRVDQWEALAVHDEEESLRLLEWADVVICEWMAQNAVWYSRHKRPGQRLIVRFHRFEKTTKAPEQIDIDAVDQVVCVSPYYADLVLTQYGWPKDKVTVIANYVDCAMLDRPKLPGAEFHLGVIGMAPMRKRTDLALDVLARIRRQDDRFALFVKTKMPWDYWWIWRRPEEQEHMDDILRRLQRDRWLRDAVVFDHFGPDVGAWLRKIGFVLSTSDDESFHLAPAEGMASGAVPAVRVWPGAESIYDPHWVEVDIDRLADTVLERAGRRWSDESERARKQVALAYDLSVVLPQWGQIVHENLEAADVTVCMMTVTAGEASSV